MIFSSSSKQKERHTGTPGITARLARVGHSGRPWTGNRRQAVGDKGAGGQAAQHGKTTATGNTATYS